MKNIYAYIRVSTVKQGDGVSLEVQKRDIERFAQQKNLNIVEWFEEQKSASKGFRPKFNQMIEQLYSKKADGFVAHKIDRMMRNRHDWAIINELIDEGCEVLSADGTTLDDVNGRFMGDIQAAVATRYSHNLAEETKKGLYGRLAQGIFPFQAPVGYLNNGKGQLKTPDPVKAPLIQKLFDLYVNKGYSTIKLFYEMESLGLTNTNGKRISKNGIITILRNSFYTGLIRIKGKQFKGNHLPIIPINIYKKAQSILDNKANTKVFKHDFLFRKTIICNSCKYRLTGELQKGNVYYRCQTKECNTTTIRESSVLFFLEQLFQKITLFEEEINDMKSILGEHKRGWKDQQNELLKSIHLKTNNLKTRQERITNLLIEGSIENEVYQSEKRKILEELKQLEEQEKTISDENLTYLKDIEQYLELAKTPYLLYQKVNSEEKKELLKIITSNLLLEGKKLVVTMLSPFYELTKRAIFSNCSPDEDVLRNMESKLVLPDHNESEEVQKPLDKEGCRRFVDYLIKSFINHNYTKIPHELQLHDTDIKYPL